MDFDIMHGFPGRGTEPGKPLQLLVIGNSFSRSLIRELPQVMAAQNRYDLDLNDMYIGGCSLERHINEYETAVADPEHKPYRIDRIAPGGILEPDYMSNLPEMLKAREYDLVSIQQASPQSFRPESWVPWGDKLVAIVREALPGVKFVIQETWSYRPDSPRFADWGIDSDKMFEWLREVYLERSRHYGFPVIPTGDAVQTFRRRSAYRFAGFDPARVARIEYPQVPPADGDIVGSYRWKEDENGVPKLTLDAIHLNRAGEYLQACVWFGALFGADVRAIEYVPEHLSAQQAALLRECAALALEGKPEF